MPPDDGNAVTVGCDPDCKLELGLWCSRASRSNQMHWRLVDAALETCNSSTASLRVHMMCRDRDSWCGGMDSREHDMYGRLARAASAALPARADTRPMAALLRLQQHHTVLHEHCMLPSAFCARDEHYSRPTLEVAFRLCFRTQMIVLT